MHRYCVVAIEASFVCACVCACVRACVRAFVRICVSVCLCDFCYNRENVLLITLIHI